MAARKKSLNIGQQPFGNREIEGLVDGLPARGWNGSSPRRLRRPLKVLSACPAVPSRINSGTSGVIKGFPACGVAVPH